MSLKTRLYLSCGLALLIVLISGGMSLYFISSITNNIGDAVGVNQVAFGKIIEKSQQDLLIFFIIMLLCGVALILVAPHRTVLPLKRLFSAFREAEEGNLSVRLSSGNDEKLGEVAHAFNSLLGQLEELDDKRVKKIAFEQRKFETLANLLDYAVFICSIEHQVVFANSQVYRALNLSTMQVIGVQLEEVPLPKTLVKLLNEAVSRKERAEDMPWELIYEKDGVNVKCPLVVDIHPITTHTGEIVNMLIILEERDKPRAERIFHREEF